MSFGSGVKLEEGAKVQIDMKLLQEKAPDFFNTIHHLDGVQGKIMNTTQFKEDQFEHAVLFDTNELRVVYAPFLKADN